MAFRFEKRNEIMNADNLILMPTHVQCYKGLATHRGLRRAGQTASIIWAGQTASVIDCRRITSRERVLFDIYCAKR